MNGKPIENAEVIKKRFYQEAKGMEDDVNFRLNYINALLKKECRLQDETIKALKIEKAIAKKELDTIKELKLRTETYSFNEI